MKKLLALTAVLMLTVGSATGCRGLGSCFRNGDRCDQCDPCAHACNVTTPIIGGGPETLLPSPAPTRNHNVLPHPADGSASG